MKIYDRIKLKRLELNMTQEELAEKMGYKSRSAINKIEKGLRDITQSQIVLLSKALDCTPAYLMGWEEHETDNITPLVSIEHLSIDESELLNNYRRLNTSGREKAFEYVADLTTMEKYIDADVKSKLG